MSSAQINEINKLLLAYSAGKYKKKGHISSQRNEYDAIISALNMLGEELFATTVSRNYFSSIYNSVTDMLFVLSRMGKVLKVNKAVVQLFNMDERCFNEKNIGDFIFPENSSIIRTIKKQLVSRSSYSFETNLKIEKKTLPVSCTCSRIFDRNEMHTGYLLIAEDISSRKASEQKFLRAIIDTQERERLRISKDMHDSMGLHLAAQKMYIGSLKTQLEPIEGNIQKAIYTLSDLNSTAIANMRSACFDLMPSALEKNGIDMALRELLQKLKLQNQLVFHYSYEVPFKINNKFMEITIYRIIQEFINNTIKHARASNVFIKINSLKDQINLHIHDDGIGFDADIRCKNGFPSDNQPSGQGLNNIATRVKALNGTMNFSSKVNKGTALKAFFPLT